MKGLHFVCERGKNNIREWTHRFFNYKLFITERRPEIADAPSYYIKIYTDFGIQVYSHEQVVNDARSAVLAVPNILIRF